MTTSTNRKRIPKATPKPPIQVDQRAIVAHRLDRLADHALHLGYHVAAERLSRHAAEMRGAA